MKHAKAVAGGALILSLSLHGVGLALSTPPEQHLTGRSEGGNMRFGNSFQDVAGQAEPVPESEMAPQPQPQESPQAPAPEPTETPPQPSETVQPSRPAPTETTPAEEASIVSQSAPVATAAPTEAAAVPLTPDAASTMPETLATPVADTTAPPPEPEVLTALPDDPNLVSVAPRPPTRPADLRPDPPRRTASESRPRQSARPQQQAQRRGAPTGTETGRHSQSGQGGRDAVSSSTAASDSEAAAFRAAVHRRIERAKRRVRNPVNASGIATVRFVVTTSGTLASIRILRSSGNARTDRVALQIVQRAVPFPIPPRGVNRSFDIPIRIE